MTLRRWCALSVSASYPLGQRMEIVRYARAYIEWLDSLPLTKEER